MSILDAVVSSMLNALSSTLWCDCRQT